jgi:serine protease inhibitor
LRSSGERIAVTSLQSVRLFLDSRYSPAEEKIVTKQVSAFLYAALAAIGCSRTAPVVEPAPEVITFPTVKVVAPAKEAAPADLAILVKGNTDFALDLHRKLAARGGNLVFSPYSISTALVMTYAGARGKTADEIARCLRLGLESDRLHPTFATLQAQVRGDGAAKGAELHVANALWVQKGWPLKETFSQLLLNNYGATPGTVDFERSTDTARQSINRWAANQTKGKIPEVLPAKILNDLTRLVLTNAVYFKAQWRETFVSRRTQPADFQVNAKERVSVPMMNMTESMRYAEAERLQVLELPYVGNYAMVILLPRAVDGLPALEESLSADKLNRHVKQLAPRDVHVRLPKLRLSSQHRLKEQLQALGMTLAFTKEADFGEMTSSTDPMEQLHIKEVVHSAFLQVNEEGTEAAAATAVIGEKKGEAPTRPVSFWADRPFMYLIRDMRSGTVLFLGRVTEPRDASASSAQPTND